MQCTNNLNRIYVCRMQIAGSEGRELHERSEGDPSIDICSRVLFPCSEQGLHCRSKGGGSVCWWNQCRRKCIPDRILPHRVRFSANVTRYTRLGVALLSKQTRGLSAVWNRDVQSYRRIHPPYKIIKIKRNSIWLCWKWLSDFDSQSEIFAKIVKITRERCL